MILRTATGNMIANKIKTWIMFQRAELPMSLNIPGQLYVIKKDSSPRGYVTDSADLDF